MTLLGLLRSLLVSTIGCLAAVPAIAQDDPQPAADAGELNIYSARHYDTDLQLYALFTEETGIKINVIEADSDALIARMEAEGEFSPADLLITVDAGRLWRAEQRGLFQPVASDVLAGAVPEHLRHPEGLWFGLAKRVRVIVHNRERVDAADVQSYAALASQSLKGEVCMRSSSNIYNISLLASVISRYGAEPAADWAAGVVANFARDPQGNDTAQIRAVAAGECGVSMVNSYYLARLAASDAEVDRALVGRVGVVFPDQTDAGAGVHANISGAGVAVQAPNRDNAVRFLEFAVTPQAQALFANGNQEYPITPGLEPSSQAKALGDFIEDPLNVRELGVHQSAAVMAYDSAGWR